MTCPPASADTFDLHQLEGHKLLYFDLHGERDVAAWFGDQGLAALTAEQLREVNLGGAVVFALNCYLADEGSPMMDALLDAGVNYVVGGDGQNWAGSSRALYGAALLGLWFRRLFMKGISPPKALAIAKRAIWAQLRLGLRLGGAGAARGLGAKGRIDAARDTLGFRVYYRE